MKYSVLVTLFALVLTDLGAQNGQLSGKVIDARTHEPLPFTNVYVNKTTIGTTTDMAGEFILKGVPIGTVEVVFSFIGYAPHQLKLNVAPSGKATLAIELNPDAAQLSEVEIKSSRDKAWEKQLKKFEKVFLGTTSNCTILNPWVIEFSNGGKEMKAAASLPIEIENRLLGYKLFFQLKNFSYSEAGYSIMGNVRFTELTTTKGSEALNWTRNREHAYLGSARHLMKSILDQKISKEGFVLYKERIKGRLRSRNFSFELDHNLVPYDTSSIIAQVVGKPEYRISLKDKLEVHYNLDFTGANFYTDINYPVSWIEVQGGSILIDREGIILNSAEVTISGDMATARVANMLPLDYKPGTIVVIESAKSISAKRLQEKVFVHTDKSYYYPGDKIWFSAYMNYRAPALRDSLSTVLYVDFIGRDGVLVQNRILEIDSGRTAGYFSLPDDLDPGDYLLRAYTQWMQNYGVSQFYYQPIQVFSTQEGVDEVAREIGNDNLLRITFDRSEYKKRSKVKLSLYLDTTSLENPAKGSLSVAIIDEKLAVPVKEASSIKSDFEIPEPSKEMLPEFRYAVERGMTIKGVCLDKRGKGRKAKLIILPENLQSVYSVTTLDNGEFSLKGLTFYDSAKFGIQPRDEKVIWKKREVPGLPEKLPAALKLHAVPLSTPYTAPRIDTLRTTMLKEVNVTEKRIAQYENSYAEPDFYIKSESIETYQNLAAAIAAKLPQFKLTYYEMHWYLIWARGEFTRVGAPSEPVLYVDQALVVGETVGDRLYYLNPAMIDHIEVKGMIGSNLGANGANGMISVFTKRYHEPDFKGLTTIKARGFDRLMPFMGPNYANPQINSSQSDYRSTLYWNPRVHITSAHPVELSFYTSDRSGNYRIIVQGVTSDGHPMYTQAIITVKEE